MFTALPGLFGTGSSLAHINAVESFGMNERRHEDLHVLRVERIKYACRQHRGLEGTLDPHKLKELRCKTEAARLYMRQPENAKTGTMLCGNVAANFLLETWQMSEGQPGTIVAQARERNRISQTKYRRRLKVCLSAPICARLGARRACTAKPTSWVPRSCFTQHRTPAAVDWRPNRVCNSQPSQ